VVRFRRQLQDGVRSFCRRNIFVNFDAVVFQAGEQMLDFFSGMLFVGEETVHLIGEQIAALFADVEQLADLIVFFFLNHQHEFSPVTALPELAGPSLATMSALTRHTWMPDGCGKTMNGLQRRLPAGSLLLRSGFLRFQCCGCAGVARPRLSLGTIVTLPRAEFVDVPRWSGRAGGLMV